MRHSGTEFERAGNAMVGLVLVRTAAFWVAMFILFFVWLPTIGRDLLQMVLQAISGV